MGDLNLPRSVTDGAVRSGGRISAHLGLAQIEQFGLYPDDAISEERDDLIDDLTASWAVVGGSGAAAIRHCQSCLDRHRCGHGRIVMQGMQSWHRAEAMTRSLVRPNSRLQCQQTRSCISSRTRFLWRRGSRAAKGNVPRPSWLPCGGQATML